jgi:competence protein ComEA
MALIELETDAARAGRGSKRVTSRTPRGGSCPTAPAATGVVAQRLARFKHSIWAPIALKLVGIVAGMLALAVIGAASIARGSGVPVTAASQSPAGTFLAGGLAPVTGAASAPPSRAVGAPPASAVPASDAGAPAASLGLTADGKVILNLASADEMRKLPGIGAKRAQAIVELRTKLGGRFKRLTDLLRVKGIGPKGLKKMEPHLVLDPPKS